MTNSELNEAISLKLHRPILDYCGNWNDLMPLLLEYASCIWISGDDGDCELEWWGDKKYLGGPVKSSYSVPNENPQRALAECLLKLLNNRKKCNETS